MMSKLTTNEKGQIQECLRLYVSKYPSQNKAAQSLTGTSSATVSSILQGKWENISDEMWRNLASQLGTTTTTDWQVVETKAFQEMTLVMKDAQAVRNVTWIVGEAGCGKTTTARLYATENSEVFYILCSEDARLHAASVSAPRATASESCSTASSTTSFRCKHHCCFSTKPTNCPSASFIISLTFTTAWRTNVASSSCPPATSSGA